jgi:hypothetical protein
MPNCVLCEFDYALFVEQHLLLSILLRGFSKKAPNGQKSPILTIEPVLMRTVIRRPSGNTFAKDRSRHSD